MTYVQTYTPAIDTPATPGMCLQYIDDAGRAPRRSGTAKAAYAVEKSAKRITKDQFPNKVWVVVWFSFSKGSYTYPNGQTIYFKDAWHVAFARRDGDKLEIHDSEVHSGARQKYPALAAVESWFAAYGAKYVGWSTHCDGRQYAKKEEEMVTKMIANCIRRFYTGKDCTDAELKKYVGKVTPDEFRKKVMSWPSFKNDIASAKAGKLNPVSHMPATLRTAYKAPPAKSATKLKPGLYEVQ